MATLKKALVEAEKRAATERTEREKYEAEVGKVRQELQALMEKHESLELDSKTRASELATAIENAKSAKAESQKTLQELDEVKKIAAGKAFFMQSKKNKRELLVTYPNPELSRSVRRSSPECVRCRRILSSRGGQLDREGVLVSVC